ncbi:MAG TPA: GFA family protein [Bradyrhizobium sp.]|nr:GFA family protein [Bradyrhizobium sp.]
MDDLPLTYACHCLDCQSWSGSAFGLHAMVPESSITLQGNASHFRLPVGVESMPSDHIGCASCFTRIANRNSAVPEMLVLRVGTLERSNEVAPAAHIWTKRKQAWIRIEADVPSFDETPTPQAFAAALAVQ